MDTSDPDIEFDSSGVCHHCQDAEKLLKIPPYCSTPAEKEKLLHKIVEQVKKEGLGKKYDCIIGVSGGADSTYLAYLAKKLGLRPLAVHLDNGWDSETAVRNIELVLKSLDIDLFTHVIDWEEFKDLQISFLKASTPDSEIPTDHAIMTLLYQTAVKQKVRYVLIGFNSATESILPPAWSQGHADWRYIRRIHQKFGTKPLKTFPHRSFWRDVCYRLVDRICWVRLLNFYDYNKSEAIRILHDELGWKSYGLKHYESVYTRFYQSYILPVKFNYDKRRAHFSSLIVSGQLSRQSALEELKKPPYDSAQAQEDREYILNKFGFSEEEFKALMKLPKKKFEDYPSYRTTVYYSFFRSIYRLMKKIGFLT